MNSKQVNDSVFDALFRQAVIDNFYEELDSLPSDEELAKMYIASPEHEERMKKLFARMERKDRIRNIFKTGKRIAAAIVIAVTILFGALMLVPQVRAAVTQTIVSWYQEFVRFTSRAAAVESASLEPAYIPEGFWEELRNEMDTTTTIFYINEEGIVISFQSNKAIGVLSVDNEYAIHEIRTINGIKYHILMAIEPGGENSIVWDMYGWRYLLRSTISVEYLQIMASTFG